MPQPQAISGSTPAYDYNAQGELQRILYPDGSVYTYQYNAQATKSARPPATGKTWSYLYDQNHHPVSIIDPDGRVTHSETPPNPPGSK